MTMARCVIICCFAALIDSSSSATTTTTKAHTTTRAHTMTTTKAKTTTMTMAQTTTTTTAVAQATTTAMAQATTTAGASVTTVTTTQGGGAVTTVTTTGAHVKFSGSLTMAGDGLNQTVIVAAAKGALGAHFDIDPTMIAVDATESRRLDAALRRLPGTWNIVFEFHAPPSKAAAVEAAVAAATSSPDTFKQAFTATIKTHLIAAGAPASAVNSFQVTGVTATKVTTGPTTSMAPRTTTTPIILTSGAYGAYQTAASVVVIAAIKMMLVGM